MKNWFNLYGEIIFSYAYFISNCLMSFTALEVALLGAAIAAKLGLWSKSLSPFSHRNLSMEP